MKKLPASLVLIAILFLMGFSVWRSATVSNEAAALITELCQSSSDQHPRIIARLADLGDAAYPELAKALSARETKIDRLQKTLRARLPTRLRTKLPAPLGQDAIRRTLASCLDQFGPAASRALVGSIHHGLDPSLEYDSRGCLRALRWSIPESPKAILLLSNWLAHPAPYPVLFSSWEAPEVWPYVPHLAPLLLPWLQMPSTSGHAAAALGLIGTNAAFAVPHLIEVAEIGWLNGELTQPSIASGADWNLTYNRHSALLALGRIGVATPDSLECLLRASTNVDQRISSVAACALKELGPKALPILPEFLATLNYGNPFVLQHQLDAVGRMGPGARAAIPDLLRLSLHLQFSFLDHPLKPPTGAPRGIERTMLWQGEPQAGMIAAALALARIDLHLARQRLEVLAFALHGVTPPETISLLRPLAADLVPLVEDYLEYHSGGPLFYLARNVLILDPNHIRAREILKHGLSQEGKLRFVAARALFQSTGETHLILPVLAAGLSEVNAESGTLLTTIAELGSAAQPLVPKLRALLYHHDQNIRLAAGSTLRAIAPESLPAINEHAIW